mmetsp:Transcript_16263/g.25255  ORF Transcript_16263/g.25255 Transcript_16263/m.25255 type:complete len:475 (+) Transcript_16263:52-1476(+)|eukprot:CAMPEP_0184295234 /NCGR_PEP_ID=MMETSP1049-20130417/6144_1 /TAXON_ID=77928 /ORGANISM="Proteomonas sulcata, Strain CCMP704" /LENGTH=474 /DNA_ID=CAMNT_0026603693 /DNA_START=2063 /DNA_END=3487 /DNA_ORIENTATION=-
MMQAKQLPPREVKYPDWKGSVADAMFLALEKGSQVPNPFDAPANGGEELGIFNSDLGLNKSPQAPATRKEEVKKGAVAEIPAQQAHKGAEEPEDEDALKAKIEKRREQNREAQRRFRQRARAEASRPQSDSAPLTPSLDAQPVLGAAPSPGLPAAGMMVSGLGASPDTMLGKRFRDGPAALPQKPLHIQDKLAPAVAIKSILGSIVQQPHMPVAMPQPAPAPAVQAPALPQVSVSVPTQSNPAEQLLKLLQIQAHNKPAEAHPAAASQPVPMPANARDSVSPTMPSTYHYSSNEAANEDMHSTDCEDVSRQGSVYCVSPELGDGKEDESSDNKKLRRRVQNREAQRRHRARAKQVALSTARTNASTMAAGMNGHQNPAQMPQGQVDLQQLLKVLAATNLPPMQGVQQHTPQVQQQQPPAGNLQQFLTVVGQMQPQQQQFQMPHPGNNVPHQMPMVGAFNNMAPQPMNFVVQTGM